MILAIALLDIQHARITRLLPLGLKDLRVPGNGLDASDQDGIAITAATAPELGMTDPISPVFQAWANNRTYGPGAVGPDSGPEGLAFASRRSSPTGEALLLVGNEISGSVTAYAP